MSLYFVPDPANVTPEVLAAQAAPPAFAIESREEEAIGQLRELFFPDADSIYLLNCARQGLYEMVFQSLAQGNVLICANGPYSEEWHDIGKTLGIEMELLDAESGSIFSQSALSKVLDGRNFNAILFTEIESFTGTMLPIREYSQIIHEKNPEALIIADITGSISGVETLSLKEDVDVLICASEGALGLPPGLGIAAINERANIKASRTVSKSWNFSLIKQSLLRREQLLRPQPPYPLLSALIRQMERILAEGLDVRIRNVRLLSSKIRLWARERKFEVIAADEFSAPTVTALRIPQQFSPDDILRHLEKYGIAAGKCQGKLGKSAIVIAHHNGISEKDLDMLLEVLDRFMADYDTRSIFRNLNIGYQKEARV